MRQSCPDKWKVYLILKYNNNLIFIIDLLFAIFTLLHFWGHLKKIIIKLVKATKLKTNREKSSRQSHSAKVV